LSILAKIAEIRCLAPNLGVINSPCFPNQSNPAFVPKGDIKPNLQVDGLLVRTAESR